MLRLFCRVVAKRDFLNWDQLKTGNLSNNINVHKKSRGCVRYDKTTTSHYYQPYRRLQFETATSVP